MSFPFKSPAKSYAPEPPETPYQRARQEWDRRMGVAVMAASSWRAMAFAALLATAGMGGGLIWVSSQNRTHVHVVEVSPEGAVLSVRSAEDQWTPSEAQTAHFIGRFVRLIRSLPTDAVVLRENWLDAYKFVTPEAAVRLSELARQDDPFGQLGTLGRTVHVRSIVARSKTSWQVSWSEETVGAAYGDRAETYTGLFTVELLPPRTADQVASNPLGLFITDFSWSRDR